MSSHNKYNVTVINHSSGYSTPSESPYVSPYQSSSSRTSSSRTTSYGSPSYGSPSSGSSANVRYATYYDPTATDHQVMYTDRKTESGKIVTTVNHHKPNYDDYDPKPEYKYASAYEDKRKKR